LASIKGWGMVSQNQRIVYLPFSFVLFLVAVPGPAKFIYRLCDKRGSKRKEKLNYSIGKKKDTLPVERTEEEDLEDNLLEEEDEDEEDAEKVYPSLSDEQLLSLRTPKGYG
jgi:hypothetical protein